MLGKETNILVVSIREDSEESIKHLAGRNNCVQGCLNCLIREPMIFCIDKIESVTSGDAKTCIWILQKRERYCIPVKGAKQTKKTPIYTVLHNQTHFHVCQLVPFIGKRKKNLIGQMFVVGRFSGREDFRKR